MLSFIVPGLGHVYAGQLKKGVIIYLVFLAAGIFAAMIARSPLFPGTISATSFLIPSAIYIVAVTSAVRLARRLEETYQLKPYNKWYVYLAISIAATMISTLLVDAIREHVVQAFNIPIGSMQPTLMAGDHIFVDKLAYQSEDPVRGDVIVFKFPKDETKTFIKRVIGLPGDRIEVRNKVVYINGEALDDRAYTQRIDPRMIDGSISPRDNFGPVTVPERSYFVLGDSRDQSLDSRFWGFVERSKIAGKVRTIYWSVGNEVRWRRIGQSVL